MNKLLREFGAMKKTQELHYQLLSKIYGSDAQEEFKGDFPIITEEDLENFEIKYDVDKNYKFGVVSYVLYFYT